MELKNDPKQLIPYIKEIRKKKNGKFWSNSGVTIQKMESVCHYFTDYTNAWSMYQLRLEVVNESKCELVLRRRTETY